MSRTRRSLPFVAILMVCVSMTRGRAAQQPSAGEYQVKAVYLFNFGRFTEWPATSSKEDVFPICVLGTDPFGKFLDDTLTREVINNQKLIARRIANARDAAACKILFISNSEAGRIKETLSLLKKAPILTVSDIPEFMNSGGMIEFVLTENKVRFAVNLSAAENAGLNLSSQLLKVATEIKREPNRADRKP
jgi:YfiR/HmsC-like